MNIEITELTKVIEKAFDEPVKINIDTKKDDLILWDSMNHLNLIIELEDYYNVKFCQDEIVAMDSVKKIVDFLDEKVEK